MASPFNIENYLDEIVAEIEKRHEKTGDVSPTPEKHKEAIRSIVGEKLGKQAPQQPAVSMPIDDEDKSYNKPELKPAVGELIGIIFEKDLDAAIAEVQSQNNPALLDAFHDALVDKLYDQLIQTGKLKAL